MKKLFSTMLALAMLAAAPLTVFASGSSNNTGGNTQIDVNGKYIEGSAATMISVDITWDDMSFEYNDGERTWDPDKHEYVTSGGSWTNEKKTVNVKNHSNTAVKVDFSFASSLGGINGSFDNKTLQLETAVGKSVGDAPTDSTNFGISGSKINADAKLGTITLNISADTNSDVTVPEESSEVKLEQNTSDVTSKGDAITTYEQLVNALKNGGDITLEGDIEITNPIAVNVLSTEINLNSHRLIGNGGTIFTVGKGTSFTLSNGNIELNEGCCVSANGAQKVKFIKCTVKTGNGLVCNVEDSEVTFDTCNVSANSIDNNIIKIISAQKLIFRNSNKFLGQISSDSNLQISFMDPNCTLGFDPSNYENNASTIEKNDADNTWTVK